MNRHQTISASAALSILATVILAAFVFRAYLLEAAVGWFALRMAAHRVRRHLGVPARRRRPKSSWSSLGRTAAIMYAAWNSRWLKPPAHERASVKESAETSEVPPRPLGELPPGY